MYEKNKSFYTKPQSTVHDFTLKYGYLQEVDPGVTTSDAYSNRNAAVFEDEEDENEARRNHEVWDDEE